MYRTIIIDDEVVIRRDMQNLLTQFPEFIYIGGCGSIAEAQVLLKTTEPDLVLLDIQLIDGNAFELLASLEEIRFKIIFVTAFNDQAIRAIKLGALDYLLKPIDENAFAEALQKMQIADPLIKTRPAQLSIANEHWNKPGLYNRIVLRSQNTLHVVAYDEIVYCEGDAGYTTFFLTNNRKTVSSKSIKEYEDILPSTWFVRTHQSYLVNLFCIEQYHKDGYLILKNGVQIPVASRKKANVIQLLTAI